LRASFGWAIKSAPNTEGGGLRKIVSRVAILKLNRFFRKQTVVKIVIASDLARTYFEEFPKSRVHREY
jgi:hypothetical protein